MANRAAPISLAGSHLDDTRHVRAFRVGRFDPDQRRSERTPLAARPM